MHESIIKPVKNVKDGADNLFDMLLNIIQNLVQNAREHPDETRTFFCLLLGLISMIQILLASVNSIDGDNPDSFFTVGNPNPNPNLPTNPFINLSDSPNGELVSAVIDSPTITETITWDTWQAPLPFCYFPGGLKYFKIRVIKKGNKMFIKKFR